MLRIDDLRNLCHDINIVVTKHAKSRLAERGISIEDIENAIRHGEIIEQYEDDTPFPSCLLLGLSQSGASIHLVVSMDSGYLYIITAYFPADSDWENDFKTRKGR